MWESAAARPELLAREFRGGWLTFRSTGSFKRLTPVPDNWETLSDAQLELLCWLARDRRREGIVHARAAGPERRRPSPPAEENPPAL